MRKISISKVLEILEGQHLDLQWRYLEHLIHSNLTQDSSHHTMHAHVLIKSICESHHDIEDVSISPDKGDGWGLEVCRIKRFSSIKTMWTQRMVNYAFSGRCSIVSALGKIMLPNGFLSTLLNDSIVRYQVSIRNMSRVDSI